MKVRLFSWIRKHKTEFWLLLAILLIASLLRLWRIDEYLPFLGDEGRDVRVVRRFLTDFDLMFVGPRTSIGDMYLGPAYYYLIAPFLLLFNFSPTGPAVFVALLSVATVFLVWFVAREWFGKVAAFSAALLYALSSAVIGFAQHSWNPNIMPFFSLLSIYSIWRIWRHKDFKWLLVLGFSAAIMLQSHYLGLLLFPTLGIVWFMALMDTRKQKGALKPFVRYSISAFALFLLLMLPLFLFDAKHDWHNFEAMKRFFTERQETISAKPWNALPQMLPLWNKIWIDLFGLDFGKWPITLSTTLILLTAVLAWVWRSVVLKQALLVATWLLFGLVGLALYKQNVYTHYFGFLFTVPFLLCGFVVDRLGKTRFKWLAVTFVFLLAGFSLVESPLKYAPQRQMQRVQEIDKQIIQDSAGQPFNFALIAERNYEEGYLYFFELMRASVREIDPSDTKDTLTEQLYVVCEDPVCEPINHRKAEIANFGWAKIEKQWGEEGHKIFKLVHTR